MGVAAGLAAPLVFSLDVLGVYRTVLNESQARAFLAVWGAHSGVYLGGVTGLAFGVAGIYRHRRSGLAERPARGEQQAVECEQPSRSRERVLQGVAREGALDAVRTRYPSSVKISPTTLRILGSSSTTRISAPDTACLTPPQPPPAGREIP